MTSTRGKPLINQSILSFSQKTESTTTPTTTQTPEQIDIDSKTSETFTDAETTVENKETPQEDKEPKTAPISTDTENPKITLPIFAEDSHLPIAKVIEKHSRTLILLDEETSTTTLIRPRIRAKFQGYVKSIIQYTRSKTKAQHHIEVLSEAIRTENPPPGLKPRIPKLVPNPKAYEITVDWETTTHTAALSYTRAVLNSWKREDIEAEWNISKAITQMEEMGIEHNEMKLLQDILVNVEEATKQDQKRKKALALQAKLQNRQQPMDYNQQQQRPRAYASRAKLARYNSRQQLNQDQPSTSGTQTQQQEQTTFQHQQLPQRSPRERDGSQDPSRM